jgi:hypothetical protein
LISRPQLLSVEASPSGPRGEIVIAHRLARDCLVILGWAEGGIAAEGLATVVANGTDRGRFRAVSWSSAETSSERWYVAALRVPEVGEMKPGEGLLLQGAGSKASISANLPSLIADSASFAAELRNRAKGKLDEIVRFLLETFSSRASRQLQTVSAFLTAILDSASEEAGVVEILGAIDGEGLMLQGWLSHPLVGRQRLLLLGNALEEHEAICANFSRTDLEGRGLGMLALVRPRTNAVPEAPRKVYLQAGDRFCRLNVLSNAMRLRDDEAPNQLRAMLPNLTVDDNLQRMLRIAARPRYSGIDTVSSLDQPVRMAIDLAARITNVGWYVTGWLLDPANLVSAVMLRGRDGAAERLDRRWTRVPRDDVTAGFRNDPLFQGLITNDLHGFTIFVPHRLVDGDIWLELQFGDDHQAFMPLRSVSGEGSSGQMRLVESFDIHKPSARNIVEHHLGPLFHAAKSAPKRSVEHGVLRDRKAGLPAPEVALIVPITEPETRTKIVVSQLAARDPGPGVVPIFVCSSAISEATSTLLRELDFYDLDAIVLLSTEPVSACEALEIGVRATRAAKLVFMLPSTHPLQTHWAAQLAALLDDDGGPMVASPTLLYEDWSICYGGIDGVRFLDAAPFADAASSRAGYPRESMPESGVTPTLAASLACCAMPRSAFEQVDGFGAGYALARLGGLDLFLRMRAAGTRMIWVPHVEAYTLGDAGAQSEYCNRTGELVDGWSLRASWKNRVPPVVGLASSTAASEDDQPALVESEDTIRTDVRNVDMDDDFRATGTENG